LTISWVITMETIEIRELDKVETTSMSDANS
jgi:hypothetical protein